MHHFLNDDEINEHIKSLNEKQREIFDVVLDWAKKQIQNKNSSSPVPLDPIHLFLTGSAGVGKSHQVYR